MASVRRRWIQLFIIVALVLLADQVSKNWIVTNLTIGQVVQPIPSLSAFFQIARSQNVGAAFGFLPQAGDLFLLIGIGVVVGLLLFYHRIPADARWTRIGMGLVCGGALGNAIDRLTYGHVVDFINYQIPGVISNVSNLADHAIVIGVILIFIESWRAEDEPAAPEPPPPA
jgi:signal peptidase II